METRERNRTIALAALFQSANLVDRLATHGQIPPTAFEVLRNSLFQFDVPELEAIYRDNKSPADNDILQNLNIGFRVSKQVFLEGATSEYTHTIRYVMALIQLEKHFRKAKQMQQQVSERLRNMPPDNQMISELYLETLAKLPFRIQVLGKMQHLQNLENEHQVRTLLFSGLRAAMIWHQNGGRRWHFLFQKSAISKALENISS